MNRTRCTRSYRVDEVSRRGNPDSRACVISRFLVPPRPLQRLRLPNLPLCRIPIRHGGPETRRTQPLRVGQISYAVTTRLLHRGKRARGKPAVLLVKDQIPEAPCAVSLPEPAAILNSAFEGSMPQRPAQAGHCDLRSTSPTCIATPGSQSVTGTGRWTPLRNG
jgi:hypothetical protein